MEYYSEQDLMFSFLKRINYNQSWEGVENDMGYDLGDYFFKNKKSYEIIRKLAKQNWIELYNFFDENGN